MNLHENIRRILREETSINEFVIPPSVRRRLNSETFEKFIRASEYDLLFYCDHYVDVEDYVGDVIGTAIGNFLYVVDEDIEDKDYYNDLFDYVQSLCWDLYSESLKDTYKNNCIDKKNK
jgi:hypothetical protein